MPVYEKVTSDVQSLIERTLKKFHKDLVDQDVSVGALFAHAKVNKKGLKVGPALRFHGYVAFATIRVTSLKERVQGLPDAEMLIDGDRWPDLSKEQHAALIDHELEHLELKRDKVGDVKLDDLARPLLGCRLHDFQLGGFESIIRRHQDDALELSYVKLMLSRPVFQQLKFSFPDEAQGEETPVTIRMAAQL